MRERRGGGGGGVQLNLYDNKESRRIIGKGVFGRRKVLGEVKIG